MSKIAGAAPQCTWVMRFLNGILCILSAVLVFVYFRKIFYIFPLTVETLWQISLAEINRQRSRRRIRVFETPKDLEWANEKQAPVRCMASVVGYREDPAIFRKCMESYRDSPGLEILLVGIDGNEAGDMEMANIVRNVHAKNVSFVPLLEPLGILAVRVATEYAFEKIQKSEEKSYDQDLEALPATVRAEAHDYALKHIINKASMILERDSVRSATSDSLRVICITQPHSCKKEIMFTNMIFSLALSKANGIEYLWTSDSDTWIQPSTIPRTVGCMAVDEKVGGSCSSLSIHNGKASTIAALGEAAYWSEMAITRGQTAAVDAADCQPGPCAAFRLEALGPILLDWYTQTSLGVKTIVNEDRHLTTRLLLDNWNVSFNTEALAFTDTPTTLIRWLLQQLRWARATHIETFQYPTVFLIHGPLLFVTAMRRFYGPLLIAIATMRYVLHGDVLLAYALWDLLGRVFLCTIYNFISNKSHVANWTMIALSQFFYQLPLPAIIFWSTITVLESNWGTTMRNKKEVQKQTHAGWDNLGAVCVVTGWMGFVAAALARYWCGEYEPMTRNICMLGAALGMCSVLFWGLLAEPRKR